MKKSDMDFGRVLDYIFEKYPNILLFVFSLFFYLLDVSHSFYSFFEGQEVMLLHCNYILYYIVSDISLGAFFLEGSPKTDMRKDPDAV